MVKQLINISTHGRDLDIAGPDWEGARSAVGEAKVQGLELYPVGSRHPAKVPADLVSGIHLSFFVIIAQIWESDRKRLLEIFGDEETVKHFYGGLGKEAIIGHYRNQLRLAHDKGAAYCVFHASHCELEYIFDWSFPWDWERIVDLSAQIVNEVTADTPYRGWILFENLWWPGGLRLDSRSEIDRLLSQVNYSKAGLCLDTGHILNKNWELNTESEAVAYLLQQVENLGDVKDLVKTVHMSKSLSAKYALSMRDTKDPYAGCESFWDRLDVARHHVRQIDRHDPFTDPQIAKLFELIEPDYLVHEFSYRDREQWLSKVFVQQKALAEGKAFTA